MTKDIFYSCSYFDNIYLKYILFKVGGPALKLLCHLQNVIGGAGGEGAHAEGHPIPDHHGYHCNHHQTGAGGLKATERFLHCNASEQKKTEQTQILWSHVNLAGIF